MVSNQSSMNQLLITAINNHHQHTECKIDPCFITDETISQQGSEVNATLVS